MDCLTFLERKKRGEPRSIYVVAGDEVFLRRQALAVIKEMVLEGGDDAFGYSSHAGDKAEFSSVRDDLSTVPFLGAKRLVVVEDADPFITKYRAHLEKYVAQPAERGVLVLDVKTFPSNTKLAKLLDENTISCKAPAIYKAPEWCVGWASSRHGKKLTAPAAQLLVDLIGAELGQLDQELTKLTIYVGDAAKIDVEDVDALVGRSRGADTFKILDAIGAGKPGQALTILERLFDQGEEPLRILGALSAQLRRLAQAARLTRQGVPMNGAFDQAGIAAWPAARQSAQQQLRHFGPRRADLLHDWLLETDLGIKGSSQLPPRAVLERLVVRLALPG